MRSLLLISGTAALAAALAIPACAAAATARCTPSAALSLDVEGSTLCVMMDDHESAAHRRLLQEWVERSARIVAHYYAGFPAPLATVRIRSVPGADVNGGRATNDAGLMIQVSAGRDTTAQTLAADWVLVHEMVHLALPDVGRRHDWLAEGLATYVEGIARAQTGNRAVTDVWAEYRHSMPLGLPGAGEGGMDESPTWGRTYWGGALYCLQSDVAIRERTHNQIGLQQALRGILKNTGGYKAERDIQDVLRIGDAATGTTILQEIYERIRATPQTPDLDLLWRRLGVPADPKTQPFDDRAPLADIRLTITKSQ